MTQNEAPQTFGILNHGTGQEIRLAMESLWLTGRIVPAGARLLVAHTFRCAEPKPVEVVYAFGLPRDAALRRFTVVGEKFRVRSELQPFEAARQEYERGIAGGHLSALARAYRDGRVNLSLGNLRPGEMVKVLLELVAGVDLRDNGLRFRFPFTLAPCYHRAARALAVAPGQGELELPQEEFGDLLLPAYLTDDRCLHGIGFDLSLSLGVPIKSVSSPSHSVRVEGLGDKRARVSLSVGQDVPDRDLVLEAQFAADQPYVCGGCGKDGRARFNVVAPSTNFGKGDQAPRTVMFILDRSGSMEGASLEQARRAVAACLSALTETDHFGLVAFDNATEAFRPKLLPATMEHRAQAGVFLDGIHARGGTELAAAVEAAMQLAAGANADFIVVTDGQVSGTESILARFRDKGSRLHCLGIGSASQDRFLALLARATGGVSRFVTPRERVDLAALELFASIGRPLANNVQVVCEQLAGARAVVAPPATVFAGQPCVLQMEAAAPANGELSILWHNGNSRLAVPVSMQEQAEGEVVRLAQGARLITDLEAQLEGELDVASSNNQAQRNHERVVRRLEELSRAYGLASRAMSLVAVIERPGDEANQLPVTRIVPVGMPQDVGFDSYFRSAPPQYAAPVLLCEQASPTPVRSRSRRLGAQTSATAAPHHLLRNHASSDFLSDADAPLSGAFQELAGFTDRAEPCPAAPAPPPGAEQYETVLMEHAARLLPDGGLPGANDDERILRSLALLICFLGTGHHCDGGAFRLHVRKLVEYMGRHLAQIPREEFRALTIHCLRAAEAGGSLPAESVTPALRLLEKATLTIPKAWAELQI